MGAVSFKWNSGFWPEVMRGAALRSALQSAAEQKASEARAQVGTPSRQRDYRNADFYADVVTRHGSTSDYPVGLVRAGNPRSIYKSIHDGALQ